MKKDIINENSINDINYELLKKQFPNAVSIDDSGKYIIDPAKLQMSLDPSKAEIREDGYGLNWVGKKEAYHKAFTKNHKVLKPLKDDSKDWDKTDNILLKGDNIDALKILRHNYFESIKMIYIDPPYNTKNDGFVYNDNFTTSTKETLDELGYDKDNIDYIENIQGAKTHSGWLSFIYPRLLLAKDLMRDDGVIFISINDNEIAQCKLLCDEIFGEDNFISEIIWHSKYTTSNDAKYLSSQHEYILFYSKNKEIFNIGLLPRTEKQNKDYKNKDNDPKGKWKATPIHAKSGTDNSLYTITFPNNIVWTPPKGRYPRYSKKTLLELFNKNELYINSKGNVDKKTYLSEVKNGITSGSIWHYESVGHTHFNNEELAKLLGKGIFENPKGTKLINRMMKLSTSKNDIILDFFAGSGTTAHAVMKLNAEDGGNRKFILVQIPEATPPKSEAKKAGYDTIFSITQERINRAGDKIIKDDLTLQDLDIGFRTFEIVDDKQQKIYQKSLQSVTQDDLLAFTENSVDSIEDILYNLLVAESLPLSSKIDTLIKDKLYFSLNSAFVLGDISIDELIDTLKIKKELEYITIYSPNINSDKFTLELESAVGNLGLKRDKLRFRG